MSILKVKCKKTELLFLFLLICEISKLLRFRLFDGSSVIETEALRNLIASLQMQVSLQIHVFQIKQYMCFISEKILFNFVKILQNNKRFKGKMCFDNLVSKTFGLSCFYLSSLDD